MRRHYGIAAPELQAPFVPPAVHDALDGLDALPGFSCPVLEIFEA